MPLVEMNDHHAKSSFKTKGESMLEKGPLLVEDMPDQLDQNTHKRTWHDAFRLDEQKSRNNQADNRK